MFFTHAQVLKMNPSHSQLYHSYVPQYDSIFRNSYKYLKQVLHFFFAFNIWTHYSTTYEFTTAIRSYNVLIAIFNFTQYIILCTRNYIYILQQVYIIYILYNQRNVPDKFQKSNKKKSLNYMNIYFHEAFKHCMKTKNQELIKLNVLRYALYNIKRVKYICIVQHLKVCRQYSILRCQDDLSQYLLFYLKL